MPAVDGTATVTIKSAVAGRWSINVYPKDLDVTSASVNSGKTKQDAMQTSQTLHFDTDNTNIIFCADVIGSTDVWGTVTYEDGSAYEMSYNNYSGRLEYPMNYVKAGDYTVDVYFYENTAIQNITTEKNTDNYTDEIIRIEE
jgi:hypothetical protein